MSKEEIKKYFENLLDEYNQTWYDKDLKKLKEFYDVKTNSLIYFDNHQNNDTFTVEDHLKLVSKFFQHGKQTESGSVEKLIIENFNVFENDNSACLCFIARYNSFPKPAIRTTMYAEKIDGQWKFKHVHCSFEPKSA